MLKPVYQTALNSQCVQQQLDECLVKLEKSIAEQARIIEVLVSNLAELKEQLSSVLALDDTEIFKAANVNM